ncbi:MAG: asparagine synthase (glutamine-hydrolyzing) [Phycisphaerales bacterium]|nr:asparagine synthase (glutamine-hydrolyzing) [Phycisphaerales bacterium]
MCGIGGIVNLDAEGVGGAGVGVPRAWGEVLEAGVAQRGRDGRGWYVDERAVLVHRRLAIIDLGGGEQPMRERADDGAVLVFNGCVYNHRELRRELIEGGQKFVTDHSDTEVLLRAWRAWGDEAWGRVDGMYAAAVWEPARGELTLARDRMGEKPLYVTCFSARGEGAGSGSGEASRWLAFSSSAAALVKLRGVVQGAGEKIAIDRDSVVNLWARFGWGTALPMEGVFALRPGQSVVIACGGSVREAGSSAAGTVWPRAGALQGRVRLSGDQREATIASRRDQRCAVERLDEVIGRAVASRLEADVPLGCFLSGGVDSSLIVAHASKAMGDPQRLLALTVKIEGLGLDETPTASAVARHLNVRHEIVAAPRLDVTTLVGLIEGLGLPLGDSSLLPTFAVCKAAGVVGEGGLKVALSGDGGDELFAGYERTRAARWLDRLRGPARVVRSVLRIKPGGAGRSRWGRLTRFVDAAAGDGYADVLSILPRSMLDDVLTRAGREMLRDGREVLRGEAGTTGPVDAGEPRVAEALGLDLRGYLPEDILRKTDTASMAVPIEVRSPLLAAEVVRLASSLRVSELYRGGRKGLLRAVARRHVPGEIVDAPKRGFAVPIGAWFRSGEGGFRSMLLDGLGSAEPFGRVAVAGGAGLGDLIDVRAVRRMLDEHDGGSVDHGQRLYLMLVLMIWGRWLDGVGRSEQNPIMG